MNQHRSCKLEASGNLGKTFARHCGRHEQTPWRWKRFSFRWKMFLQVEKSQPSWNRWKEVSLSCKKRKIPEVGSVHCTVAHCALLSTEWGESFAPNFHLPTSVIYLFSPFLPCSECCVLVFFLLSSHELFDSSELSVILVDMAALYTPTLTEIFLQNVCLAPLGVSPRARGA